MDYFDKAQDAINKGKLKKAFRCYLKGVLSGETGCELNLGYCYDYGIGVRRHRKKAEQHYRNCMERGDPNGANNLGVTYFMRGDLDLARQYLQKAVELGAFGSAIKLAEISMLENDLASAKKYYEKVLEGEPYETVTAYDFELAEEKLKELQQLQPQTP